MQDRDFLLTVNLAILTLIIANFSMFLKSFSSSELASPEVRQAAQHIKFDGVRKKEQEFWGKIKDVNFDKIDKKAEITPSKDASDSSLKEVPEAAQKSELKNYNKQLVISKSSPEKPYSRFLFVGDSIMFDLGIQLQTSLQKSYQITNTKLDYKISTGLSRIDYYDWYARTDKLIKDYQPDVLVVMFGGNDDKDITDSQGKYRPVLTEEWKKAYRERVERYAQLVSSSSSIRKVYWIGQPITSRPRYNKFFPIFNQIYKEVSQSYPKLEFISSWERFSVNGKFAAILADKSGKVRYVKTNDGVHFTPHGAKILSDLIIDRMVQDKILKGNSKVAGSS